MIIKIDLINTIIIEFGFHWIWEEKLLNWEFVILETSLRMLINLSKIYNNFIKNWEFEYKMTELNEMIALVK